MEDALVTYWLDVAQRIPSTAQLERMRRLLSSSLLESNNPAQSKSDNDGTN